MGKNDLPAAGKIDPYGALVLPRYSHAWSDYDRKSPAARRPDLPPRDVCVRADSAPPWADNREEANAEYAIRMQDASRLADKVLPNRV